MPNVHNRTRRLEIPDPSDYLRLRGSLSPRANRSERHQANLRAHAYRRFPRSPVIDLPPLEPEFYFLRYVAG